MTRREMLMERYEDALFALLMNEVAEAEGRKALEENQRLCDSGEMVIPEAVHRRCLRTIARKTAQKDVRRFGRALSKAASKVAIIALVGMLTFTTVFAASDDFRVRTLNFIIATFDDRAEIRLPPEQIDPAHQAHTVPQFSVGWLPEGFALIDAGENQSTVWANYKNDETGASISIFGNDLTAGGVSVDTEDTQALSVQLHGGNALLIEKNNIIQVRWQYSEKSAWLFSAIGQNMNRDTLLKVAESTTIK